MYSEVEKFVKACPDCQCRKNPKRRPRAPLIPITVEGNPFDVVSSDAIGPLPATRRGNKYIICFQDHLTRYPYAFAVPDIKSPVVAKLLYDEII
jgi:hypothetical protein